MAKKSQVPRLDGGVQEALACIRRAQAAIERCRTSAGLAGVANEAWRSAERHALVKWIEAGSALLAAKARVAHGSWTQWLEHEWEQSSRSAQICMQVAEHWSGLASQTQRAAFLRCGSVRHALATIPSAKAANPKRRDLGADLALRASDPKAPATVRDGGRVETVRGSPPGPSAVKQAPALPYDPECPRLELPPKPERPWAARVEFVDAAFLDTIAASEGKSPVLSRAARAPIVNKTKPFRHGGQLFLRVGSLVPELTSEGCLVAFRLVPRLEWTGETLTPIEVLQRRDKSPVGCRGVSAIGLMVLAAGKEHVAAEAVEFAVPEQVALRQLRVLDERLRFTVARLLTGGCRRHLAAAQLHVAEAITAAEQACAQPRP